MNSFCLATWFMFAYPRPWYSGLVTRLEHHQRFDVSYDSNQPLRRDKLTHCIAIPLLHLWLQLLEEVVKSEHTLLWALKISPSRSVARIIALAMYGARLQSPPKDISMEKSRQVEYH
ncbi:hypothetical protein WG66_014213 [Moniliophthora roreri]|nr:hypothetical protein WG66_014213 [Moniliophthora roreri]